MGVPIENKDAIAIVALIVSVLTAVFGPFRVMYETIRDQRHDPSLYGPYRKLVLECWGGVHNRHLEIKKMMKYLLDANHVACPNAGPQPGYNDRIYEACWVRALRVLSVTSFVGGNVPTNQNVCDYLLKEKLDYKERPAHVYISPTGAKIVAVGVCIDEVVHGLYQSGVRSTERLGLLDKTMHWIGNKAEIRVGEERNSNIILHFDWFGPENWGANITAQGPVDGLEPIELEYLWKYGACTVFGSGPYTDNIYAGLVPNPSHIRITTFGLHRVCVQYTIDCRKRMVGTGDEFKRFRKAAEEIERLSIRQIGYPTDPTAAIQALHIAVHELRVAKALNIAHPMDRQQWIQRSDFVAGLCIDSKLAPAPMAKGWWPPFISIYMA